MSESLIYLDGNATTPLDPLVLEEMLPYFKEDFANAASFSHVAGRKSDAAVEKARGQIAKLLEAEEKDIIFTSGATESINLALKGFVEFNFLPENALISTAVEHKAVLESLDYLVEQYPVVEVEVDRTGQVNLDSLEDVLSENSGLVSVQHVNNEIGSVNNLYAIGALCRKYESFLHVDAAQSFGKLPIDVNEMNIDLLSISAHKVYGPKGVGALYVRRRRPRIRLTKQQHGGKQERDFRAGSLNVPGIVGLGKAAELAGERMVSDNAYVKNLTEIFRQLLSDAIDDVIFNGPAGKGLPGNLNFTVPGLDARELLCELPMLAMSTGSACTSELSEPSHVLRAIGVVGDKALATLRVGMTRFTTEAEVRKAAELLINKVINIRKKTGNVEQVS
ncbi:MAG: cysteine desulfurase [Lentisphaeraceae bacterium]|nr:cysteine desulfurase [Lentisphaeraceae bacterium]